MYSNCYKGFERGFPCVDKSHTKIEYFDENKKKVIDNKIQVGRKLVNNLQNSWGTPP
jgi:hypothetical protein